MLNGGYTDVALAEHSATLSFYYILCHRLDDRLTLQVDALYLITGVLWGRLKVTVRLKPVCNPLPHKEKLPFNVFCFDIVLFNL